MEIRELSRQEEVFQRFVDVKPMLSSECPEIKRNLPVLNRVGAELVSRSVLEGGQLERQVANFSSGMERFDGNTAPALKFSGLLREGVDPEMPLKCSDAVRESMFLYLGTKAFVSFESLDSAVLGLSGLTGLNPERAGEVVSCFFEVRRSLQMFGLTDENSLNNLAYELTELTFGNPIKIREAVSVFFVLRHIIVEALESLRFAGQLWPVMKGTELDKSAIEILKFLYPDMRMERLWHAVRSFFNLKKNLAYVFGNSFEGDSDLNTTALTLHGIEADCSDKWRLETALAGASFVPVDEFFEFRRDFGLSCDLTSFKGWADVNETSARFLKLLRAGK